MPADTTVVHVLTINWNEHATPARIARFHERLLSYARSASGVLFFACGGDLRLLPGNADYAIVATFDSVAAFDAYRDHPEHLALTTEDLVPIVADRSRVQLETEPVQRERRPVQ
jgi:hypothetical protein